MDRGVKRKGGGPGARDRPGRVPGGTPGPARLPPLAIAAESQVCNAKMGQGARSILPEKEIATEPEEGGRLRVRPSLARGRSGASTPTRQAGRRPSPAGSVQRALRRTLSAAAVISGWTASSAMERAAAFPSKWRAASATSKFEEPEPREAPMDGEAVLVRGPGPDRREGPRASAGDHPPAGLGAMWRADHRHAA